MLTSGDICTWNNAGKLTRVVVVDGPRPAAEFNKRARARRIDRFALVAVLSSGECAIVHVDDLDAVAEPRGAAERIRGCA